VAQVTRPYGAGEPAAAGEISTESTISLALGESMKDSAQRCNTPLGAENITKEGKRQERKQK